MRTILFTEEFCQPENMYPFSLTRQTQDIRIGILTIREKWEKWLNRSSLDLFQKNYKDTDASVTVESIALNSMEDVLLIHANVLPDEELVKAIKKLKSGEFISVDENQGIIFRLGKEEVQAPHKSKMKKAVSLKHQPKMIRFPWDIFRLNDWAIRQDVALLTAKRRSRPISKSNAVRKPSAVFIEKGAVLENCIINAETGPVYIGKNALVMEGSMIRGPFSIGEGAVLKMGSRVYGATTVGPYCTVGGEVLNTVFLGYCNKAHDGYLGNSVVGEWCNLGAGTSNSNIKNSAGPVSLWTPSGQVDAGQKCGAMIGDYTRTAINTSINTGAVIGISCNVFGNGLTPAYIPDFSWGSEGIKRYEMAAAIKHIESWKKLKGHSVSEREKNILEHIFNNY